LKTIILAGGLGTRISEETADKPKPMVLIDHLPILWHIMNIYAIQGFDDFVIATGYKGSVISDWIKELDSPWKIRAVETGVSTQTAGRIKMCMDLYPGQTFLVTYGDGLGNVNLHKLTDFHFKNGKLATVTAVRPPARFGYLSISNGEVKSFGEKNQSDSGWINGGFFVLDHEVASFIDDYNEPFERGPILELVNSNNLMAFEHTGYWQPMDTLREKQDLSELAKLKVPPWLLGI
jgi:glucose-1-phosphate cytidylyltransferase